MHFCLSWMMIYGIHLYLNSHNSEFMPNCIVCSLSKLCQHKKFHVIISQRCANINVYLLYAAEFVAESLKHYKF